MQKLQHSPQTVHGWLTTAVYSFQKLQNFLAQYQTLNNTYPKWSFASSGSTENCSNTHQAYVNSCINLRLISLVKKMCNNRRNLFQIKNCAVDSKIVMSKCSFLSSSQTDQKNKFQPKPNGKYWHHLPLIWRQSSAMIKHQYFENLLDHSQCYWAYFKLPKCVYNLTKTQCQSQPLKSKFRDFIGNIQSLDSFDQRPSFDWTSALTLNLDRFDHDLTSVLS